MRTLRILTSILTIALLASCAREQDAQPDDTGLGAVRSGDADQPAPVPGIEPVEVRIFNLIGDLQEIGPSDPLILQFSSPVTQPDDRPALTMFPMLDGSESWNEPGDTLTFTPIPGFAPGVPYTIYLDTGLRGPQGEGVDLARLDFNVLSPPQVLRHSPGASRLETRLPAIEVHFDRSMDRQSVAKALLVDPEISVDLHWSASSQVLTLSLREPLQVGERYLLTVGADAADEQGVPLGTEYRWAYWLEPLRVEAEIANLNGPIELQFNYPISPSSLSEALAIEPSVSGEIEFGPAQNQARVKLPQTLDPSTEYQIQFTSPLRDPDGHPYPEPLAESAVSPAPILSTWPPTPGPDGDPLSEDVRVIDIEFDRPMNHDRVQGAFSIDPHVPGNFSWEGDTLTYQLEEALEYRVPYTVTIGDSAIDADGRPAFRVPYSWTFSHWYYSWGDLSTFGQLGSKVQVVDADGRRSLEFGAPFDEPAHFTFEMHKLSTRQFAELALLDASFNDPRLSDVEGDTEIVSTWEFITNPEAQSGGVKQTLIPNDVRPGLYLLRLWSQGRVEDEIAVALTSHTLAVKQSGRQVLTWATDINGESVEDVEVRIFASDGRLIREGSTGKDGLYEATLSPGDEPVVVFGRTPEGGSAVAALHRSWKTGSTMRRWWGSTAQEPMLDYLAYIYTDRPIYRPGQTVFFKAIVREDLDARYRLLAEDMEVALKIRDARDNLVETQQFTLSEFSTLNGQFAIGEAANLGTYSIELEVDGETHRGLFKVQDYRKPDVQVEIRAGGTHFVEGERIPVEVNADYFFGEPVADADVTINQYSLGEFYGYWWEPLPEDQEVEYVWYPTYRDRVGGRTDSFGQFSTTLEASLTYDTNDWGSWRTGLESSTVGIEVTIDDGSRQVVADFVVVKVFNSDAALWLDTGGYFRTPGSSAEIQFGAMDLLDKPVAGRELQLEMEQWNWDTRGYTDHLIYQAFETGVDGSASIRMEELEAGFYRLTLTDLHGIEPTTITRWMYVYDRASRWARRGDDQSALSIQADQDTYSPYDRANLVIESVVGGPALLTFERGSVLREQVIELTPPITTIEVPILEIDAPNVFVNVAAWEPLSTIPNPELEYYFTNLPASRLMSASLELQVETTGLELDVSVESDRETYAPGEEVELRLQVTRANGEPAAAEVSVALVDEAIYALSEDLNETMVEAFYGRRGNRVRTYNSLAPYREIYEPGRGGGGGGDFGPGNPRTNFEDLAAWFPNLRSDEYGEVTVTLTLPHNLTSWRIVARAVTRDTRVGEGHLNIVTKQPLVVRPILPRNLTAGDNLTLSALVHNFSDRDLEIEAVIEAHGLSVAPDAAQSIGLGSGDLAVVGWPVAAPREGDARVTISVRSGDFSDAVELPLVIQPLAIPDVETQIGSLTGSWSTTLNLPRDASPLSTVTLELDRSVAGTVLTGLDYLTGFPYGCVEQIMSRALPNAVVGRAAARLGLHEIVDLDKKVNQGLQMLYAKQHSDGGWGWWYDDASQSYQTAWVLFGLAVTRDAGYMVDPESIERGAAWLSEQLEKMDPRTRAYALYSLALAGYPEVGESIALSFQAAGLDAFSQAALALALHEAGETGLARELAADLEATAAAQSYWPSVHEDGYYYEKTMSSTTRNTALVLDALVKILPDSDVIDGAVRWLVSQRGSHGWGTTNETSYAILALTDYLTEQEATKGPVSYRVMINNAEYDSGVLEAGPDKARIMIPADDLEIGENDLTVEGDATNKLYYSLTSRIIRPQPKLDPAGLVRVERTYYDAETGNRIERVEAGQLVEVVLEIEMPTDGFYLLIEDKVPGGLEALNEALNSQSHELDEWGEDLYRWHDLGYNYKEVRADRVSFFVTELYSGAHSYRYTARATHSGEFTALPAEVSAMYDASLWGRSGSSLLEVYDASDELVSADGS